jgi:hypothetical protein
MTKRFHFEFLRVKAIDCSSYADSGSVHDLLNFHKYPYLWTFKSYGYPGSIACLIFYGTSEYACDYFA